MKGFAVIGLGQFGRQVAVSLAQRGHEVLAIDTNMARVEEIKELVARSARADASELDALRALAVQELDTAVVAIGDDAFEAAVLAVANLAQLGVRRIVARSSGAQRGRVLSRVGAHQVVFPEVQMAEQLARALSSPGVVQELALPTGHALAEIQAPERFLGMTLKEAALRESHGVTVLAIHREEDEEGRRTRRIAEAGPTQRLTLGDVLVVVGEREKVEAFARSR